MEWRGPRLPGVGNEVSLLVVVSKVPFAEQGLAAPWKSGNDQPGPVLAARWSDHLGRSAGALEVGADHNAEWR